MPLLSFQGIKELLEDKLYKYGKYYYFYSLVYCVIIQLSTIFLFSSPFTLCENKTLDVGMDSLKLTVGHIPDLFSILQIFNTSGHSVRCIYRC